MRMSRCLATSLAVSLAVGACSGAIDGGATSGSGSGNGGSTPGATGGSNPGSSGPTGPAGTTTGPGGAPAASCKAVAPGPSPIRRLTRAEYNNTVRDLLGDDSNPASNFPDEETYLGFDNNATTRSVSSLLEDGYFDAAAKLADGLVAKLPTVLACDPAKDGEPACLDRFLDGFAKRAWRRPLEADERDNLKKTFTDGRTATFGDGINAVVQVLLLSPQFLYRVEKGVPVQGADYLALTQYELASRLSYLMWGSMPDADLMAAADSGALGTREAIKTQAQRLLKDPRAATMMSRFSDEWLRLQEIDGLDKDPDTYPNFTTDIRGPMRMETQSLIDKVVWHGDGKLSSLLTSKTTFVNATLAKFYGMNGVTGDAYQEVPLDTSKRLGFLGHAGLLSVLGVADDGLTSLVYRGLFVRANLFCQQMGDPPANAQAENPPFTPTTTAREWSEARQAKANCGACHRLMDPIGFGFENFDAIGQWRDMDRGKPIDSGGMLSGSDIDGPFSGVVELANKLSTSQTVSDCMATQWFRYGYGRQETNDDSCSLKTLQGAFTASKGSIPDLLVALTQTDAFMFRSPPAAQTTTSTTTTMPGAQP